MMLADEMYPAMYKAEMALGHAMGQGPEFVDNKVKEALRMAHEVLSTPQAHPPYPPMVMRQILRTALQLADGALSHMVGYGPAELDATIREVLPDIRKTIANA